MFRIFFILLLISTTVIFALERETLATDRQFVASSSYMEALLLFYEPEDLVVVATGVAQPISKAPSVATVITAEDIKALGGSTLHEILESVAGLHMVISTVHRAWPTYTFRGIYTSNNPQVLFLLNGKRISSTMWYGGRHPAHNINIQNISRIEVVRGPGSAIYGADAFSGVINIITKSAEEIGGMHAGVRSGSFNTKNGWFQYGNNFDNDIELAFSLEYNKEGADKSRIINSDVQSFFDGWGSTSATLAPSYIDRRYEETALNLKLNNRQWEVAFDGWWLRDIGIGSGVANAIDHEGHDDHDQYHFSMAYNNDQLLDNWDLTGQFNYTYIDFQSYFNIFPAGARLPIASDGNVSFVNYSAVTFPDGLLGNPGGEDNETQLDFIASFNGFDDHHLRFNVGHKYGKEEYRATKNFGPGVIDGTEVIVDGTLTDVTGTDAIYGKNSSRTVNYLSLQDIWSLSPTWELTTGLRYDKYSDFGNTVNPRVALVWTSTPELTSKLLYGRAFRAPSYGELYAQNNPVLTGNDKLDPEIINTVELAFDYRPIKSVRSGLNLYYFKTDDMIVFVDDPAGGEKAQNSNSQEGHGLELEAKWDVNSAWQVSTNYSWQVTKDDNTHIQVPFVSKHQLYVDNRFTVADNWQLSAQWFWIGERERENGDLRSAIDDYSLVNLTVRRTNIGKGWELAGTVKNLFNEDAREPSNIKSNIGDDFPLNERSFFVELSYHFDADEE